MSDTRKTLAELFERAGIRRHAPASTQKQGFALRRELQSLRFAQLYVRNRFDARATYNEFHPGNQSRSKARRPWWQYLWLRSPLVQHHIRQIVQEATEVAKDYARVSVDQLLAVNEMVILNDVTNYLEEAAQYDEATGVRSTYVRYKPIAQWTIEQRMAVKSITVDEKGNIVKVLPYDAMKAKMVHIALMEVLQRGGGSDANWNSEFKQRMSTARAQRIQLEIERGKVLRLPVPGNRTNDL